MPIPGPSSSAGFVDEKSVRVLRRVINAPFAWGELTVRVTARHPKLTLENMDVLTAVVSRVVYDVVIPALNKLGRLTTKPVTKRDRVVTTSSLRIGDNFVGVRYDLQPGGEPDYAAQRAVLDRATSHCHELYELLEQLVADKADSNFPPSALLHDFLRQFVVETGLQGTPRSEPVTGYDLFPSMPHGFGGFHI